MTGGRLLVALVEDDARVRKALARLLMAAGFAVGTSRPRRNSSRVSEKASRPPASCSTRISPA
jgi:FixJ family two-component response regulator